MFGWIKNPFGRKEDYSDIKGHMLGEGFGNPSSLGRSLETPVRESRGFEHEMTLPGAGFDNKNNIDPSLKPVADFRRPGSAAIESYGMRRQREEDNDELGIPDDEFSMARGRRFDKRADIEKIVNTLLLMKEQLAAIKAQNEMINERLKNLERAAGSESY